jgi:hypothetical protein
VTVELEERVEGRLRLVRPLAGDDPVAFARLAARLPAPARVVLRDGVARVEWTCHAAELAAAREALEVLASTESGRHLPVAEVAVGTLTANVTLPAVPAFLRLAPAAGTLVDRARATYLLVANAHLGPAVGGWLDGPGLVVEPTADLAALRRELLEVATGLRALGDERLARAYSALGTPTEPCVPVDRHAST